MNEFILGFIAGFMAGAVVFINAVPSVNVDEVERAVATCAPHGGLWSIYPTFELEAVNVKGRCKNRLKFSSKVKGQ